MNQKSIILVCLTTLIFAVSLLFLPVDMVSHINALGISTSFINKYYMFLVFTCVNIVGSIFWNLVIEKTPALIPVPVLQAKLKIYFSFLMLLLFLAILTSSLSSLLPMFFLLVGHVPYIIYLFNKRNNYDRR